MGLHALDCIWYGGNLSPPNAKTDFDHFLHLALTDILRRFSIQASTSLSLVADHPSKDLLTMASAFLVGLGLATSAFLVSERMFG